jgi:hypothetical protein
MIEEIPAAPSEDARPIPGFPGYVVTVSGEVWSNRSGSWYRLKPYIHNGYPQLVLSVERKQKTWRVGNFVLLAFVGPRPSLKHCCRHLDGNKLNNHLNNLVWGTYAENNSDTVRHGRRNGPWGETHPFALLTEEQVKEIRRRHAEGEAFPSLGKAFGVHRNTIGLICRRIQWKQTE